LVYEVHDAVVERACGEEAQRLLASRVAEQSVSGAEHQGVDGLSDLVDEAVLEERG
jgi:hypothetical protein